MAHVVAYRRGGPRGGSSLSPAYLNNVDNLMLLCQPCHTLVDRDPKTYTVNRLKKTKRQHEERIEHLTGLSANLTTDVVRFTATIGGRTVRIPFDEITKAVEPYYPRDRKGTEIDLTNLDDRHSGFLDVARQKITASISALAERTLDGTETHRLAVFALGPIPLLIHLGRELSDKMNVDVFQRHRDTEDWCWKSSGANVSYTFRQVREGTDKARVALCLSLSGCIDPSSLPKDIDQRFTVYEITLVGQSPNPGFLRLKTDLDAFVAMYQMALREIAGVHGSISELHLFPAVPAPVAVHCGRALFPKIDPTLLVYDADKAKGGFSLSIKVN